MSYVDLKESDGIATITLRRAPVNALNDQVLDELGAAFHGVAQDESIKAVVLTGEGNFFSFGFDVPGFMSWSKDDFQSYISKFSGLIKDMFMFQKPTIAAINGHAVAGGCVLALACDYRIIKSEKAKIALNEMTFGSTVFSCVTETLKYAVGAREGEKILYSGKMYSAREALSRGLVDKVSGEGEFLPDVTQIAHKFAEKNIKAFSSIKKMLKLDTLNGININEKESISEFVDVWYSDSTREQLSKIEIRS